jgi:xanthine dehydrogenase/oxidase
MPVLAADGCHITTIEGVGSIKASDGDKNSNNMHPIQKAMTELHGSQCGFCTPGIIVSIYSLYANKASMKEIEEHLDGNLCRCTGYRPIWDAARSLCDGAEQLVHGPCGTPCRECPERDECEQDCNLQDKQVEGKDQVICSTTKDKVAMKKAFVGNNNDWLEQPNKMFPKELVDPSSSENQILLKPLMVVDHTEFQGAGTWFKPNSLEDLLTLLKEFGSPTGGGYKIVVGNTEVGIGKHASCSAAIDKYRGNRELPNSHRVYIHLCYIITETKFKNAVYPRLIYPNESIGELYQLSAGSDKVTIGACTSLSTIQHECGTLGKDPTLTRTLMPIHDMLRWFASTQIRNVACLGGNLVTASPISDMNPMLASMGAKLVLSSLGEDGSIARRTKNVSEFFVKYRTVDITATEIVEKIEVPILAKVFEYVKPFKQARRREDDISIVTSGMRILLAPNGGDSFIIKDIAMSFGGMAPKTVMALETAKSMIGSSFNQETFVKAQEVLIKELNLPEDVPGGQAAYRMTLAASFLYKFYISVLEELKKDLEAIISDPSAFPSVPTPLPGLPKLPEEEISGCANFLSEKKPSFSGSQAYPAPKVAKGLEEKILPNVDGVRQKDAASAVGKSSVHQSGPLHCTGEAVYTDDIPPPPGMLHAALILARECGVVFESMDVASGYAIPGVVKICTAQDISALGGKNSLGPIVHDETVFLPVGETVAMVGQVLGIVVAETLESAEMAARMVSVTYGSTREKIVMSIENAIEAGSFYESTRHKVTRGDATFMDNLRTQAETQGANVGDIVNVSGTFHSGAQEHFYLETNATLVVPSEGDSHLTIYCSTQAATKTQNFCASSTGTPAAKVVCRVKRLGGGFGGKETRSVFASCAAAVAAKRTGRPVRLTLARNVDMLTTGQRHAFFSKYHASAKITEDGAKLFSMDVQVYNNGGAALDLSGPVADRALFHIDNAYLFPNLRVEVISCKTAQAPHTAYRGFGGPQGMVIAEHVIEHLALVCNVPIDKMRRDNLYKDGDSTHFGMVVGAGGCNGKWNVPKMYDRLYNKLDVPKRRAAIEEFNAKNKWLKRGCALIPTKFGIAFTAKFMNQGKRSL